MQIAVGTPMYGGMCADIYKRSVAQLGRMFASHGHRLLTLDVGNESLIQRARNAIAWHAMQIDDVSHLLWIDADIAVRPQDIVRMLEAQKSIIVAPVPVKQINWERVAAAARSGVPPDQLAAHSGVFNLRFLPGDTAVNMQEPFEIKHGGTGVMLVERSVYEKLAPTTEAYVNRLHGSALPLGAKVHNFHPVHVDRSAEDGDLLPEDYGFCELWRKVGGTVWAAPWCKVQHAGRYAFSGEFDTTHKPLEAQ